MDFFTFKKWFDSKTPEDKMLTCWNIIQRWKKLPVIPPDVYTRSLHEDEEMETRLELSKVLNAFLDGETTPDIYEKTVKQLKKKLRQLSRG